MSKWSQKLDAYLAVTKFSKKRLALELGISINTLEKWWRDREPSLEHATKIRQLLHESTLLLEQGVRYEDKSIVVSLLRTTCPFCEHAVNRFQNCAYCGQHFVRANVPVDKS